MSKIIASGSGIFPFLSRRVAIYARIWSVFTDINGIISGIIQIVSPLFQAVVDNIMNHL